jgi:hypothetical protein
VSSHCFSYVTDCKDIALVCALVLRKRNVKKRKKFWVHPITSQKLLKGKFTSLYEDLTAHPQFFSSTYFTMCSATLDKLLVLLGPSLTFQDTRMRKSVPAEERLAVTLRLQKSCALILIHILFIIAVCGKDKKFIIFILHYSCAYQISKKVGLYDCIMNPIIMGNLQFFYLEYFNTDDVFLYCRLCLVEESLQ